MYKNNDIVAALEALRQTYAGDESEQFSRERISEMYVRVCGDLEAVESVLKGRGSLADWSYEEDMHLMKAASTAEYTKSVATLRLSAENHSHSWVQASPPRQLQMKSLSPE